MFQRDEAEAPRSLPVFTILQALYGVEIQIFLAWAQQMTLSSYRSRNSTDLESSAVSQKRTSVDPGAYHRPRNPFSSRTTYYLKVFDTNSQRVAYTIQCIQQITSNALKARDPVP